ncbi:insulinase family protein [Alicyclobacillaceae bacterium I2511]|nr:insulinase family protein [Alicyclobacillaceae bacterium I2511]
MEERPWDIMNISLTFFFGGLRMADIQEQFQSYRSGRVHIQVLPSKQFHTRHLTVKLVTPLRRETLTPWALLPYLWLEGTSAHPTPLAVSRYAETLLGASVRTLSNKRGDVQVAELYASVPDETVFTVAQGVFHDLLQFVAQLIGNPSGGPERFSMAAVTREKTLHKKRIESLMDDKIAYALERCLAAMCEDEPAGLPRLGLLEDLTGITASQLWDAQQKLLREAEIYVYLVGRFAHPEGMVSEVQEILAPVFPTVSRINSTYTQAILVRAGQVRQVAEVQDVVQGKLNLGFRTGIGYGDKEYPALLFANGILGGFPHSKLFVHVRERAGLAYYASSRLDGLTGMTVVQSGIEMSNKDKVTDIAMEQVTALQSGEITDEEMEFTRRGLRNQYMQAMDQPLTLADIHFQGVLAGSLRDTQDILEQLSKLKKEDVAAAAAHLQLDTIYFLHGEEAAAHAGA